MSVRQGTPEWIDARRVSVTGTDIPILLGISPWMCEADLADVKRGLAPETPPTLRMRVGNAVQDLIGEAYAEKTGRAVHRYRTMATHPELQWAAASPDFRVVGERRLVEAKRTANRRRFADGLPQDVEAQVQWQLGVTGFPVADVAALVGDDDVEVFPVQRDDRMFAGLVDIAIDFRRRLAEGGPFHRNLERINRDHPADDGTTIYPDRDVAEAVSALIDVRASLGRLEDRKEELERAIKDRMGDAARMEGSGWYITWKRTKDIEKTDWQSLATGLLTERPEEERATLISIHTNVSPGRRPFVVTQSKDDDA